MVWGGTDAPRRCVWITIVQQARWQCRALSALRGRLQLRRTWTAQAEHDHEQVALARSVGRKEPCHLQPGGTVTAKGDQADHRFAFTVDAEQPVDRRFGET